MTQKEFASLKFSIGTQIKYQGEIHLITGVNFVEQLLKIGDEWVRCENTEVYNYT